MWNTLNIHILRDNILHTVVKSSVSLVDAYLVKQKTLILYAATKHGTIYRCSIPASRKKPSAQQSDEIFKDLLAESDQHVKKEASYHELKLEDGTVILNENGLKSFIISDSNIVFSCQIPGGWTIGHQVQDCSPKLFFVQDLLSHEIKPLCVGDFRIPSRCLLIDIGNETTAVKNAMQNSLFSHLFGSEALLAGVPVYLMGLPNGIIYWFQLHESQAHVLYCLDEPVAAMHAVSLGADSRAADSLLLIGRDGKMAVITMNSKQDLRYDILYIDSPVIATVVYDNKILHTTAKAMCLTDLKVIYEQIAKDNKSASCQSGCKVSCYCNVFGFVVSRPSDSGDGISILAVTKRGVIQPLDLTNTEPPQPTAAIKDQLLSIHTLTQRMQEIEQVRLEKDDILKQLSVASHLASGEKPIVMKLEVISHNMGSYTHYTLHVTVCNMCHLTLSSGWKLGLCMITDSGRLADNIARTVTTSLPCLAQNAFHKFVVELTADQLHELPLQVTVSLTYSFKQAGEDRSVSMVVLEQELDVLRFLVLDTAMNVTQKQPTIVEKVQQMAEQRPTYRKTQTDRKPLTQQIQLPLPVQDSTDILKRLLSDNVTLAEQVCSSCIKCRDVHGDICTLQVLPNHNALVLAITANTRTLCQLVGALRRKIEMITNATDVSLSVGAVSKLTRQYQIIQQDLTLSSLSTEDVVAMYTKLRSINLLTEKPCNC